MHGLAAVRPALGGDPFPGGQGVLHLPPHTRNFSKRLAESPEPGFLDPDLGAGYRSSRTPITCTLIPSAGSLFESVVVSELPKARFNRVPASNLLFWRYNARDEAGLLIDRDRILSAVEISSGQTVASDYTAGLERRRWISGAQGTSYLVHGGSCSAAARLTRTVPWNGMSELIEKLG